MLDDRDRIVLDAVRDLGGRMVRPSVIHDRLKWDYKELYRHIDHCLEAGRLSKTVVDPRGLVGYALISLDELTEAFHREMRLDRGNVLETLDRLVRGAVDSPRRRRGRPHRPHIPSDVGIAPDSELAKWVEEHSPRKA